MRAWLDRGVDGFRVDAFRHLLKDDRLRDNPENPLWAEHLPPYDALIPQRTADLDEMHEIVTVMREVLDTHPAPEGGNPAADRVMVGELYLPIDRLVRYYGENGSGMHLPSNMHLIGTAWDAAEIAALVDTYETALPTTGRRRCRSEERSGPEPRRIVDARAVPAAAQTASRGTGSGGGLLRSGLEPGRRLCLRRCHEDRELLVVLNLGGEQQDVDLGQSLSSGRVLQSTDPRRGCENVGGPLTLNASEGVVIAVAS
jgi:hypothetical protein